MPTTKGIWLLALLTIYACATVDYARVWQNELTLWTWVASQAPLKVRPHMNLVLAEMERRQFAAASSELGYTSALVERQAMPMWDRSDARRALLQNRAVLARLSEAAVR